MVNSLKNTLFLLAMLSSFSTAQNPCSGSVHTQADLTQKAVIKFRQADDAMNIAFQKVLEKYKNDTSTLALFKKSQSAWKQFRDFETELAPVGGSVESMCRAVIMTNLTIARTNMLNKHLEDREGDVCYRLPVR